MYHEHWNLAVFANGRYPEDVFFFKRISWGYDPYSGISETNDQQNMGGISTAQQRWGFNAFCKFFCDQLNEVNVHHYLWFKHVKTCEKSPCADGHRYPKRMQSITKKRWTSQLFHSQPLFPVENSYYSLMYHRNLLLFSWTWIFDPCLELQEFARNLLWDAHGQPVLLLEMQGALI